MDARSRRSGLLQAAGAAHRAARVLGAGDRARVPQGPDDRSHVLESDAGRHLVRESRPEALRDLLLSLPQHARRGHGPGGTEGLHAAAHADWCRDAWPHRRLHLFLHSPRRRGDAALCLRRAAQRRVGHRELRAQAAAGASDAMSAHAAAVPTISDVVAKIPGKPNGGVRMALFVLIAIGVIAFGATLASDPHRAWTSMALSLTYWLVVTQACIVVSGVMLLTKAKWAVPFQRIAVGAGSFLPWGYGIFVLTLLLGTKDIFPWTVHPVAGKTAYLNLPFLLVRQIGLVGICTALSMVYMQRVRRLDAGLSRGKVAEPLRARYEKWSANWKGDEAEIAAAQRDLPRFGGAMIPVYAVTYTFICWDWVMAQDPQFSAAMLVAWFFMGGILMAWAMTSTLSIIVRRAYKLEAWLTPDRYHQIGKLIFAFSIFWTYLFWSMFLPIWYGNMPEETHWVVRRMRQPFLPWSVAALRLTWFVPFTGFMNLAAKRNTNVHIFFACSVLVGIWIERLMMMYPSIYLTNLPVGLPEIGVTIGFLGGFLLAFQAYAATRPLVQLDKLSEMANGH